MTNPAPTPDPTAARPTLAPATSEHEAAMDALALEAYGPSHEAGLLQRLRETGAAHFALVADADGPWGPVGFAAFAEARIRRAGGETLPAMAVAGLVAAPQARGRGVGLHLLRAGLAQCRHRGAAAALVHARHRVFERAGFSLYAAERLSTPWSAGDVLALALRDEAAPLIGEAEWPAAFF